MRRAFNSSTFQLALCSCITLPEKLFGGNKVVEETVFLYGEVEFARRKFRFFGCQICRGCAYSRCSQGASGRESPGRPAGEKFENATYAIDAYTPMVYNVRMIFVETRLFTSRILDAMSDAEGYKHE